MNNNTERLARKWAERIMATPEREYAPSTIAAAEHILATTTPPTMADVEWDDDKHYLAEAESKSGLKVVMLHLLTETQILCLGKGNRTTWTYYYNPEDLTPTGKRYTLAEVQE